MEFNVTPVDMAAALEAHKPQIAERARVMIRAMFATMVETFGESMRGVYNSRWCSAWKQTVQPATTCTRLSVGGFDCKYEINEAKLDDIAEQYANTTVLSWKAKIDEKVGCLDDATVRRLDGCRFSISGMRAGRLVRIEQDMILNTSPKGLLFNQFPARIYVDGKFTSAAAYKKLFD